MNALELAILEALDYVIRVPASEYAKYYFHLRSMMARLGLHVNSSNGKMTEPLDLQGARKLQLATERYQEDRQTVRFSKSMKLEPSMYLRLSKLERGSSIDSSDILRNHPHVTVGLEQLIHEHHMDADGLTHVSQKQHMSSNFPLGGQSHPYSTSAVDDRHHMARIPFSDVSSFTSSNSTTPVHASSHSTHGRATLTPVSRPMMSTSSSSRSTTHHK